MMVSRPNALQTRPIIVTGLSGSGMSSVLKSLEDLGYEVFDNFPLSLVSPLMNENQTGRRPMAIGIDSRTRGFDVKALLECVEEFDARLIYVRCDEEVLQRRFSQTRRMHPLAKDRPVSDGIRAEMKLFSGFSPKADLVIDSTSLSIHDLRRIIEGHFGGADADRIVLTIMSFGYKYGLPREADIVMDLRFLRNPHWEEKLRPLTGHDADVRNYIDQDPEFARFVSGFAEFLGPLLPRYIDEGKHYLTIALGCTGGRHRSVYGAETLAARLRREDRVPSIQASHRDIEKGG